MIALLALVAIPLCIAGFGFLFTKLYSNTTWGHDAIRDMEAHESSGSIRVKPRNAEQDITPSR